MEGAAQLSLPLTEKTWCFACPDWKERLERGASLVPPLPLDTTAAERAVSIFNKLRLPDVPGTPTFGEAAGEWFRDILRAAAGSIDPISGKRMVGEILGLVPKKNNKTTGAAGMGLTFLIDNKRPRAQILVVGPTQEIADECFGQVVGMIDADEEGYLQKRFHIRDHRKEVVDRTTRAVLKIKTFDTKVMTGTKPMIVILDELHELSSYSYASKVLRQIRGGLLPKPESLLVIITTQSDGPPAGIFKIELSYARKVRDGKITANVRLLPVLYEFPLDMQADPAKPWQDPRTWHMVNPNLGLSVMLQDLEDGFAKAREDGEAEVRSWASQHLNVEIGVAIGSWRASNFWEAATERVLTLEELLARSEVVTVGIDGGGLDDLFGLAVIGRCRTTGRWLLWCRAWVDAAVLELRKDIAERLRDFETDGDLVICEIGTEDIEQIADLVEQIHQAGLLPEKYGVGLDPIGVAVLVDALSERGIEIDANGGPVCGVPQGYRLNGAIKGMERKLKDRSLIHADQPLMAWCIGNAKPIAKGNATMIDKETAGAAKIDPLVAAFNAFQLMSRNPASGGISVPDDYEVLTV